MAAYFHHDTPRPGGSDSSDASRLYAAVLADDYLRVIRFAEGGGDVRITDPAFGFAMPYWAAERGHTRTLQVLITLGADKDCRGFNGDRPAHVVARRGDLASAAALLICGANADAVNDDLDAPLHTSTDNGHEACTYLLLIAGADHSSKNRAGLTPQDICTARGDTALEFLHTWYKITSGTDHDPALLRLTQTSLPFALLARQLRRHGLTAKPAFDRHHLHALTRLRKTTCSGIESPRRHPAHAPGTGSPSSMPLSTATNYLM